MSRMTSQPKHIAMWSGPRNLSTAMMRAFGNRHDCRVVDEPFYAAYLADTGLDHPMRDKIMQSQSSDWRKVVDDLLAMPAGGAELHYQKQMTHHIRPNFGRDWMKQVQHAFLIRPPERVLASYARKHEAVALADIGFLEQAELFDRTADHMGDAPPVVDAEDIRRSPERVLMALCAALEIAFEPSMLSWPAGRRPTDGVWAEHWYGAVDRSTGFDPPDTTLPEIPDALKAIADLARPIYERLARHRLSGSPTPT